MNLNTLHNIYLIGIGGIGMSNLARYFLAQGKQVAGYDKTPSPITKSLEDLGIAIHYTDDVGAIPKAFLDLNHTLVIYTPAIPRSQTELQYFEKHHYTIQKRSEVLGTITANTFCLAVAGTHGKTTTSAILGHIMHSKQATAFLGGIAENYNSNFILGSEAISVVEADEFDRSFLQLAPDIACITSMDADHLDIYKESSALEKSFREFAAKVKTCLLVAKGLPVEGKTYGLETDADYAANNIRLAQGQYVFDIQTPQHKITGVTFSIPGRHNLMNALAASAMALEYGVSEEAIKAALASFRGVKRRFSYAIKSDAVVLIDDYAHHPTEISAVADAIKELYPKSKTLAVFQPHLFSRTQDFAADFAKSLSAFDEVVLLDIYPAREEPIEGVTSQWLATQMQHSKTQVVSKDAVPTIVKNSEASVIAMLGAGDIGLVVQEVADALLKSEKYAH